MIKRSIRYFALVLTLLAFTSTVQRASAQSSCTDPSCATGGSDPEPMSQYKLILTILATVVLP
jgi:hypothetical protein